MDQFEVRMQFLTHLRRLNASQQSIQKVVSYAVKHFSPCGVDLWDCIVEECQKGSVNARINILYFLDSLCETCLLVQSHSNSIGLENKGASNLYVDFVSRDLGKIVECVVPEGRQGLPNLVSTKQILENWRSKRVIEPQKVDEILSSLNHRKIVVDEYADRLTSTRLPPPATSLAKPDIIKRIEEDRERHKRLRERRWVQPISHNLSASLPPQLMSFLPIGDDDDGEGQLAIDIEFENEWETTSDWNEDDDEAAAEENELCFPGKIESQMDLC